MKIRVWHLLLILALAGGWVAVKGVPNRGEVTFYMKGWKDSAQSLIGLFRSGGEEVRRSEELPVAVEEITPPPEVVEVAAQEPALPEEVVAPPPVARPRQTRPPATKKPAQTKPTSPRSTQQTQSSTRANTENGLVGTYVALELNTGREVRGLFQERTRTHYVIELPGMGPFQYPIANVRAVKPVE